MNPGHVNKQYINVADIFIKDPLHWKKIKGMPLYGMVQY